MKKLRLLIMVLSILIYCSQYFTEEQIIESQNITDTIKKKESVKNLTTPFLNKDSSALFKAIDRTIWKLKERGIIH